MILPAWPKWCGEGTRAFCSKHVMQIPKRRNFLRRKRWKACDGWRRKRLNVQLQKQLSPAPVRLPDLIIVDGGKGQLSAACRELQRLGLHDLPIIGLAKEHEEIYRPGRALPLQLPLDSGALRLLQRIRDEAHRFANAYHQLLMKKRVGESILDDCPGVSQNRKNLLLRKFGSVNRLRKASVEEIAATEGIGRKLAEELHRFLQRH